MVDFQEIFGKVDRRFGAVAAGVSKRYSQATTSLQRDVAEIITDLVVNFMQPTILHYITTPMKLKDGTTVQGQSAFDRMAREDKDVLALVEKYRPSYLWYLDRARRIRKYVQWDNDRFVGLLSDYLGNNGVSVDQAGQAYLWRTVERFRRRIYS